MKLHEQVDRLVMPALALVAAHDDEGPDTVRTELQRIQDAARHLMDGLAAAREARAGERAAALAQRARLREANVTADRAAARAAAEGRG